MVIEDIDFKRVNETCNIATFWVKFLDTEGTAHEETIAIYGDNGTVNPEWCEPYREQILEHPIAKAHLAFSRFKKSLSLIHI